MNHAHDPGEGYVSSPSAGSAALREPPEPHRSWGEKRPTNLSVRADLVDAARAARLNLSALLEHALTEELRRMKWRRWREENAAFIAAYNRHVREHGTFTVVCLRL